MHEYSIVSALYDRIAAEAAARQASAVTAVHVRIGELSGVEPALLRTAYDLFREGTLCAGAPLAIEAVSARWACPACDAAPRAGTRLVCPSCGVPARLVAGDEIDLVRIELEVP